MDEKITLDRETFRALAVDTRVSILKSLDDEFQLTLTDLSERLGLAPSTVKEHLERLLEVGLIEQIDKGMKWKYYRLTKKGKQLLNPYEKRVWIVLSVTLFLFFAALYRLMFRLNDFFNVVVVREEKTILLTDYSRDADAMAPAAFEYASNVSTTVDDLAGQAVGGITSTVPDLIEKAAELSRFSSNVSSTVSPVLDEGADLTSTVTSTTGHMVEEAFNEVSSTVVSSTVSTALMKSAELPYAELTISLVLVLIAGICVGYLIRKKRII